MGRILESVSMVLIMLIILSVIPAEIQCAQGTEDIVSQYGQGFYRDFEAAPKPGFYLLNDLYYCIADMGREKEVTYEKSLADLDGEGYRTTIGDPGMIPVSLLWNIDHVDINTNETNIVSFVSYNKDGNINSGPSYYDWDLDPVFSLTYFHPVKGHEISVAMDQMYKKDGNLLERDHIFLNLTLAF